MSSNHNKLSIPQPLLELQPLVKSPLTKHVRFNLGDIESQVPITQRPVHTIFESFTEYTLPLIFKLVLRKCTDREYMDIEDIKWQYPYNIHINLIRLLPENPAQILLTNHGDNAVKRKEFETFYGIQFAHVCSGELLRTPIKDMEQKIQELQTKHSIIISSISIILELKDTEYLCGLLKKYIDPDVVNDIIYINKK